jgi:hypothetical protein
MIRCPYCLETTTPESYHCANEACKAELPRDFVDSKEPKTTVGLVGFSGHGKTVYLTSLFYLFKFLRGKVNDYYFLSLDDNTHKIIYEHVPLFEDQSTLPESTPANFPHPSLIRFHKVPYYQDWFLSFYDTAGEVFDRTQTITNQGRFCAHSDNIFLLSALPTAAINGTIALKNFWKLTS